MQKLSACSRWLGLILVVVLLGAVAMWRPILRAAGWVLVVNEHTDHADVIVIPVDTDAAGVLEAADLIQSGVATRVAVFADLPVTAVEHEFIRRGINYESAAERSVRQLRSLGVNTVDIIPTYVGGTEDEGPALADWCDRHHFHSVVVVSTSDHSRRLRRVLRRAMKGHMTKVTVECVRYLVFDPDRWWESRVGTRIEIEELEKLLLDIVRHPIS